jgi:endoglucanase
MRGFTLLKVGTGGGEIPNDHYCWERPEDLDHFSDTRRSTIAVSSGSDLAGEMAAALAAASIVFKDQPNYAVELQTGAKALYAFAKLRPSLYVNNSNYPPSERALYNSTSFSDELIWGSTWLYFATGNLSYLGDATIHAYNNSNWGGVTTFGAFDWDSKLVGAQVSLTEIFLLLLVVKDFDLQKYMFTRITQSLALSVPIRSLRGGTLRI